MLGVDAFVFPVNPTAKDVGEVRWAVEEQDHSSQRWRVEQPIFSPAGRIKAILYSQRSGLEGS